MSDDYSAACERKPATEIIVERYHHDTPGSREGITRQAGVVADGQTNSRQSGLTVFKGRETLRKNSSR